LAKIVGGMTEEQVTDFLGAAGDLGTIFGVRGQEQFDVIEVRFDERPQCGNWKEWNTQDGTRIAVFFSLNGGVVRAASFRTSETWTGKLRRWLRLDS